MDKELAQSRMKKFGIFAEDAMPEICVFSEIRSGKQIFWVAFGGPITKESVDNALISIAAVAKQKGWLWKIYWIASPNK